MDAEHTPDARVALAAVRAIIAAQADAERWSARRTSRVINEIISSLTRDRDVARQRGENEGRP